METTETPTRPRMLIGRPRTAEEPTVLRPIPYTGEAPADVAAAAPQQAGVHWPFFFLLLAAALVMIGAIVWIVYEGVVNSPSYRHRQLASQYNLAHQLEAQGDWTGMIQAADAMKQIEPAAFSSYALRAEAERRLGRYRESIADANCALQLLAAPTAAAELRLYESLSSANKGATVRSVAAGLHTCLARDEYEFGLDGPAQDDCDAALKLAPGYADALFWRAVVEQKTHQLKGCIADTTTLINHHRKTAIFYELRSKALSEAGDHAGAASDTRHAALLEGQNDDTLINPHPAAPTFDPSRLSELRLQSTPAYD